MPVLRGEGAAGLLGHQHTGEEDDIDGGASSPTRAAAPDGSLCIRYAAVAAALQSSSRF